jgi:hypothetical protein
VSDGVGGALLPRSTTTGGVAAGSSDGPAAKADEAARRTIGTSRKFSERMAPHARDDVIGPRPAESRARIGSTLCPDCCPWVIIVAGSWRAAEMMKPYAGAIEAWEIGAEVGNLKNNRPELMERIGLL